MTITPMPTFGKLVAGLARRGLKPEVRDGRLGLRGDTSKVDDVLVVACLLYAAELRALAGAIIAADVSGKHVVGICDNCGEWSLIRRGRTPPCPMTPGCGGQLRNDGQAMAGPNQRRVAPCRRG